MLEIWKDVLGYEDHYQVSNLGRISTKEHEVPYKTEGKTRVIKARIRKLSINRKGYSIVTLSKENKVTTVTVHQLVAQAFLPGFTKGQELNHEDGVKTNNSSTNLEISNHSHNQLHAARTGLTPKVGISKYHNVTYISNHTVKSKWAGSIRHNGKSCFGWKTFATEEEAALYVDALLDSISDTSRLRNFP